MGRHTPLRLSRFRPNSLGSERHGTAYVGKCDCRITEEVAEQNLNRGIPDPADAPGHPPRIYVLYDGVIYVAVPTNPGVSYHAYPWRGDIPGRRIPRRVLSGLKRIAADRGELSKLNQWLKDYGGDTR